MNALAKLHNFFIDQREIIIKPHPLDTLNIVFHPTGYIRLEETSDNNSAIPWSLLGGGGHFGDISCHHCQVDIPKKQPHDICHEQVVDRHLKHPIQNRVC